MRQPWDSRAARVRWSRALLPLSLVSQNSRLVSGMAACLQPSC